MGVWVLQQDVRPDRPIRWFEHLVLCSALGTVFRDAGGCTIGAGSRPTSTGKVRLIQVPRCLASLRRQTEPNAVKSISGTANSTSIEQIGGLALPERRRTTEFREEPGEGT